MRKRMYENPEMIQVMERQLTMEKERDALDEFQRSEEYSEAKSVASRHSPERVLAHQEKLKDPTYQSAVKQFFAVDQSNGFDRSG